MIFDCELCRIPFCCSNVSSLDKKKIKSLHTITREQVAVKELWSKGNKILIALKTETTSQAKAINFPITNEIQAAGGCVFCFFIYLSSFFRNILKNKNNNNNNNKVCMAISQEQGKLL